MLPSLSLITLSLHLALHAHAVTISSLPTLVQKDLHIVNKVIAPDGFERSTVLAGFTPETASFPGPLIAGRKSKNLKFKLDVHDDLTDPGQLTATSIHWHGFFQKSTNWADGPAFVTQCPITSGHDFNYDFSVPDQVGSYWYHSHLSVQYCDGLRGPMVVYDSNDPFKYLYDVDDETTIISLADWYHTPAQILITLPPPAVSDSTLINGKGRWSVKPTARLTVITVQYGKRYRFRLISMSCEPNYIFSIDNHRLTVIESDGILVQPRTVDNIQIFAAQRYSFVLNANQTKNNYWIRAKPNFANDTSFNNGINSAILRYIGAPNAEPPIRNNATQPGVLLSDSDLHPYSNPAAPGKPFPGGADHVVNLTFGFNFTTGKFLINNHTYTSPSVPALLQILSGAKRAQDLLPKGSYVPLPLNKVIEINMIGGGAVGGPHPFHLHGHTFSVIQEPGKPYNFKNPARRDVTPVVQGNTTTIRFVTDNPGPWFLHCHIDFHLEAGFAIVLAEDIPDAAFANPVPNDWKQLCPLYDASINGTTGGNHTSTTTTKTYYPQTTSA